MRRLARLSIRHKLSVVTLFTSLIVVSFASLFLILAEVSIYRRVMLQELAALASIIGGNASAALVFEDARAAEEILTTLAAKPSITGARIFRADGSPFARYDRAPTPPEREPRFRAVAAPLYALEIWRGHAEIFAPIQIESDTVGEIAIAADLSQLYAVLNTLIGSTLLVVTLSGIAAWWLSARLQTFISRPIFALLAVMRQVSRRNDYSLRMAKTSADELGQLSDGLNAMLERIEANDASLRSAWKEATAASRAKSEFLANMSHELRTPLNAILGFSELMRLEIRGPLGHPSYMEYVTDIYESGKHLLEVISDILDLSKIEAGELKLDLVEIELPRLARKAVRVIAQRARSAGLNLTITVEDGLSPIKGDERLLKQALLNLLSNSVKFTPKGGSVTLNVAAKGATAIVITVKDTGIGMAPQELPRVFIPFVQVESSTTRKYEGTGLGLPLTKSFVEAHGGTLALASAPGTGTTATITLPLDLAAATRSKRLAAPAPALDEAS